MPSRRLPAAAASLALAVGGVVASGPGAVAVTSAATPKPRPTTTTPTLPVPAATVDPRASVGGERLASMGLVADLPPGVPAPPTLRDVSWVLADLDTGAVVAAKAPHARLLPASTLKTLTALTLIPRVPDTLDVSASQADADADGTRVGIVPGLHYTAHQLFEALLMSSGNDAAYALAEAGGGREATLAAMNATAAHLGAHDTVAKDPSGLDAPGQTSSAYDLALIGRAALQLKPFRGYVTTKQADFPGRVDPRTRKRASFKINNHNKLLYNYPGTIGLKNGYTEAAKRTFISAVTRGGKTYLLTEMYGLDSSWRPQAAMYDWAFRYGSRARPVGMLVAPGAVPAPPSVAPSPTSPALAGPSGADEKAPDGAALRGAEPARAATTAAAAALPSWQLTSRRLDPWVGMAGLAATLLLISVLAARVRSRRRPGVVRRHH